MEVPRLEVQLELQLLDYATATAMPDPSCIRDLHHSSRQHQILNPLSEFRDRICNLKVPSQIHFCCATMGTPCSWVLANIQADAKQSGKERFCSESCPRAIPWDPLDC